MGLIKSLDHGKRLEEYEAMAGVAKNLIDVDTAKGLATFLRSTTGLLRSIASSPTGRLVIFDSRTGQFISRDPAVGAFEVKDKDAEVQRCRDVATLVQKHLRLTDPAEADALLEKLAALMTVDTAQNTEADPRIAELAGAQS